MDIFSTEGWALLLRWIHIVAGITWIGLLYYFNLVQAPFMNEVDADTKSTATRTLVPRALFWFRYSALVTWLVGLVILLIRIDQRSLDTLGEPYGTLILTGAALGTIMFLNVWGVIWPKQKVVIGSAEAAAGGKQAHPGAANAARRALLASRANVLFSIPMVFFMAASSHGPLLARPLESGDRTIYWVVAAIITALIEANALVGLTGAAKRPLEKVGATVTTGLVLFLVLATTYIALTTA